LSPGNSAEDAAEIGGGVDRLGLSATTFLMLCIWLGPDRAVFLITVAAIVALWVAVCRRWPIIGYFSIIFLDGFLGGLFGYRSYYRRRYRRWR
jgi:hypothetical protein